MSTSTHAVTVPILDDDPFSPENLEDPLPLQERLREAGPVVFLRRYSVHAVARYQDVRGALVNWQQLGSGSGVGLEPPSRQRAILQTDPPEHDALRAVLEPILSARVLRSMRASCRTLAESILDDLLGDAAPGAEVELDGYQALGSVFPVNFFPNASGIDDDGRENLLPYADHIFNLLGPRNEVRMAGEPQAQELAEWAMAKCRRDALKPEGFGADIWAAADRGEILHEQAPRLTSSLINAGLDTTTYGLSSMLYAFATHPGQWAVLRRDPGLARLAFDEALRWESPVQMIFRRTSSEVELSGSAIPAGARVLVCFAAANRDPRRWTNPDSFDLSRDPSGHLAFGMGIHQCVGQHAARLQAATLLETLAERVESIELAAPITRHHNNVLRGWESMPLRLRVA